MRQRIVALTALGRCVCFCNYIYMPVPVLSMWHVCVLLLMHYLGAAECVVASGVFCNI
jgi:hypothetical protein